MPAQPRVSIIVLNWNGVTDTKECWHSLQHITYSSYETIVVDNHSNGDDVRQLNEEFGGTITILENPENFGFAEGNNVAMRKIIADGKSKYLVLLNNDTVVEKNFLSELVKVAEQDDSIGMVGPEIRLYHDRNKIHSRGGVVNLYTGWHFVGGSFHRYPYRDESRFTLNYYSGAAVLIRVAALQKVGLFDPQYFYYTEDVDLGYRMHRAGYWILCAKKSVIYHKEGASVGGNIRNPRTAYFETRNALLFIRKHGHLQHRIVFTIVLLLKILYDLIKFFPQEKHLLRARWRGILWHFRHRLQ